MSNSRYRWRPLAAAVLVLVLSGCQGSAGEFSVPGVDGTDSPTLETVPTPTATDLLEGDIEIPGLEPVVDVSGAHFGPTGAGLASAPGTRIRSTCTELTSDPRIADLLGGVPVLAPATPTFATPRDAALRQAGVVECYSDYKPKKTEFNWVAGPADASPVGTSGTANCIYGGNTGGGCTISAQRGGYRIDGNVVSWSNNTEFDLYDLKDAYEALASTALDTLAAPGSPRAAWKPTETGRVTGCDPFDENGEIRDAFGVTSTVYPVVAARSGYFPYLAEATFGQGWQSCTWDSAADPAFSIEYAPGSSWAWGSVDRTGLSAVTVPGASEAYGACNANGCTLHVLASQTWIMATSDPTTSGLARLQAGVGAFIPLMPLDEA